MELIYEYGVLHLLSITPEVFLIKKNRKNEDYTETFRIIFVGPVVVKTNELSTVK